MPACVHDRVTIDGGILNFKKILCLILPATGSSTSRRMYWLWDMSWW